MLCLEGAQAGLSWITILRKRARYRNVFDHFDAQKMARYDESKLAELLGDKGIVRNKLKVSAFISNAQAYLDILERDPDGGLDALLWNYVDGRPIINRWVSMDKVPAQTELSAQMSKDLKKLGFRFVGPTICYAYMQSVGLVNDHTLDCFRHAELAVG